MFAVGFCLLTVFILFKFIFICLVLSKFAMELQETDVFQFIEELFQSFLFSQNIEYDTLGIYSKKMPFKNWYAILYSVGFFYKSIAEEHNQHLSDVVATLRQNAECEEYVAIIGKYFFQLTDFTWTRFRVFVAHMISLAAVAHKKRNIFVADDLLFTTALYIEKHLQVTMEKWKAFELDCITFATKPKETNLKPGNSNPPSVVLPSKQIVHNPCANQEISQSFIACIRQEPSFEKTVQDWDESYTVSPVDDRVSPWYSGTPSTSQNEASHNVQAILPTQKHHLTAYIVEISVWALKLLNGQ